MTTGDLASATAAAAAEALMDPATPSSQGAEVEVGTETPTGITPEAPAPASAEGTAEPPTEYFGVDLSELPADQREILISQWSERDKLINSTQREAAEARKAAQAVPAPPAVEPTVPELTDADLAEALGLDMEDPDDERVAKSSVPLARLVLDLKAQMEALTTTSTASAEQTRWEKSLDTLEATHGKLPVERIALYEDAAERGIADPEVAYWATVGPARIALMKDVAAALAENRKAGKQAATTLRPRTSVPTEAVALTSKDTKSATKEALLIAASELGITLHE